MTSVAEAGETAGDAADQQATAPLVDRISELEAELAELTESAQRTEAEKQNLADQLGASHEDVDAKAAAMRTLKAQLDADHQKVESAVNDAEELTRLRQLTEQLTSQATQEASELKRVQEEQIELKQQLALLNEASESWDAERVLLFAKLGLDENGNPDENASVDQTPASDTSAAELEAALVEMKRLASGS